MSLVPLFNVSGISLSDVSRFTVSRLLLSHAATFNISTADMLYFFVQTAATATTYKPNVSHNKHGVGISCWVVRGFYPKSPLFFKLTVAAHIRHRGAHVYEIYVTEARSKDKAITVTQFLPELQHNINQSIEDILLRGQPLALPKLSHEIKIKKPRCISPKGMPLFTYEPVTSVLKK